MQKERKYYYPNTTQKPNVIFDVLMPKIGSEKPCAYLVLDAMVRKIYGWGKEEDNISNSQLIEMTGLSPNTVKDCVDYLIKNNIVELVIKGHGRNISRYRLTINQTIENLEGQDLTPPENERVTDCAPEVQSLNPRGSKDIISEGQSLPPQNLITKPNNQNLKEKEEEEKPLSYMNLKLEFEKTLKEKNIEYIPARNEYIAITNFTLAQIPPENVIGLIDKLIAVKRNYPKDMFLQNICFNISDLFSYRAKILNAYSMIAVNTINPPAAPQEAPKKIITDPNREAEFLLSHLEKMVQRGTEIRPITDYPLEIQNNEKIKNFYSKLGGVK